MRHEYTIVRKVRRLASPPRGCKAKWEEWQVKGKNRREVLHRADTEQLAMEWVATQHLLQDQREATEARSWPEDYALDNGNYQCRCCACGEMFNGHKRRVLCKTCSQKEKVGD